MDVSSFLGGNFLTQLDLPPDPQTCTIRGASQQQVGTDVKICLQLAEHAKPLGLNKTNLRTIAQAYGTDSNAWIGRQVELYRDRTQFQGALVPCIRLRIPAPPQAAPPAMPPAVPPAAPVQPQPVAAPQPQQPVAPPQPQQAAPWEQPPNDNSPPSA